MGGRRAVHRLEDACPCPHRGATAGGGFQPPSRREAAYSPDLRGRGAPGETAVLLFSSVSPPWRTSEAGCVPAAPGAKRPLKRAGRKRGDVPSRRPGPEGRGWTPASRGEGPWNGPQTHSPHVPRDTGRDPPRKKWLALARSRMREAGRETRRAKRRCSANRPRRYPHLHTLPFVP